MRLWSWTELNMTSVSKVQAMHDHSYDSGVIQISNCTEGLITRMILESYK